MESAEAAAAAAEAEAAYLHYIDRVPGEFVSLGRSFTANAGAPTISRVHTGIFLVKTVPGCFANTQCNDICCQYGADVDVENVQRLLRTEALCKACRLDPSRFFVDAPPVRDPEFPGGSFTRTRRDGPRGCVFLAEKGKRGCAIHSFCTQSGIDYHELKPIICALAPLSWNDGALIPMYEAASHSMPCALEGAPGAVPIYDEGKDELLHYFGKELLEELDAIQAKLSGTRRVTSAGAVPAW